MPLAETKVHQWYINHFNIRWGGEVIVCVAINSNEYSWLSYIFALIIKLMQ